MLNAGIVDENVQPAEVDESRGDHLADRVGELMSAAE